MLLRRLPAGKDKIRTLILTVSVLIWFSNTCSPLRLLNFAFGCPQRGNFRSSGRFSYDVKLIEPVLASVEGKPVYSKTVSNLRQKPFRNGRKRLISVPDQIKSRLQRRKKRAKCQAAVFRYVNKIAER